MVRLPSFLPELRRFSFFRVDMEFLSLVFTATNGCNYNTSIVFGSRYCKLPIAKKQGYGLPAPIL